MPSTAEVTIFSSQGFREIWLEVPVKISDDTTLILFEMSLHAFTAKYKVKIVRAACIILEKFSV